MIAVAGLLSLSSILYGTAFLLHRYCWWFIFLFPVPLFYAYRTYHFSAFWGWWWSFLGTLLHMLGIIYSTIIMAEGPWYQAIIMVPIAIAINSISAIPFFYAMNFARTKFPWCKKADPSIIVFALSLSGYFYCIERATLFMYDRVEGYMLLSPLVLLAKRPFLLQGLGYIGSYGCLFIFFTIIAGTTNNVLNYLNLGPQGLLELCLMSDRRGWKGRNIVRLTFVFLIACLTVWAPAYKPIKLPAWYNHTVVVQHVFHKTPYLDRLAMQSKHLFAGAIAQYPHASLFLMPESSFYCDHLDNAHIHGAWDKNHLKKEVAIVTGAFRWHETKHRNTLFLIKNGEVIDTFDKRHAMFLVERSMSLFNHSAIHELYFKNYSEIVPSSNPRPQWKLLDSLTVTPYICSELFFNYHPEDNYAQCTILASCNDRWVPIYMKELMIYGAIKQAMQWRREIIYISFEHALYILPNGNSRPLQTYQVIPQ